MSARARPSPPSTPTINQPSDHWSCVKSCLVRGRDRYRDWRRGRICITSSSMGSASSPTASAKSVGSNQSQPRTQHSQPNHCYSIIQTALLRANIRKPSETLSGLLSKPLGRYHETTTQQPAPTADQVQLKPAAVPTQPSNSICISWSTSDHTAWTSTNTWRHIDTHPINKGMYKSRHWSSDLCNQCVHIIDHLQPDYTSIPAIWTNPRDHPHLLNSWVHDLLPPRGLPISTRREQHRCQQNEWTFPKKLENMYISV